MVILRLHKSINARIQSPLLSSIVALLSLYLPLMGTGFYLSLELNYSLFSPGIILSTLLLLLQPHLIFRGYNQLSQFFEKGSYLFPGVSEAEDFRHRTLTQYHSSNYLIYGIPLATLFTAIVIIGRFHDAPLLIKAWAALIYFIIFIFCTFALQGLFVIFNLIFLLAKSELKFDPYHPDNFGGYKIISSLYIRATLYLSIGAFLFPLGYEISENIKTNGLMFSNLVLIINIFFVSLILYSFIWPTLKIKELVEEHKYSALLDSNRKLKTLWAQVEKAKNSGDAISKFNSYYNIFHTRILKIRNYPYDAKVLLELMTSVSLPIIIPVFQKVFAL